MLPTAPIHPQDDGEDDGENDNDNDDEASAAAFAQLGASNVRRLFCPRVDAFYFSLLYYYYIFFGGGATRSYILDTVHTHTLNRTFYLSSVATIVRFVRPR